MYNNDMKTLIVAGSIALLALAGFFGAFVLLVPSKTSSKVDTTDTPIAAETIKPSTPTNADEILRLVNIERAKVGVPPLKLMAAATQSAQFKADDMVQRNYFSHTAPDSDRNNGLDYLDSLENTCSNISENIFWGRSVNTSKSAIDGWISSDKHYEAMINPSYEYTGVGIAENKVVQHFCTPN